MVDLAGYAIILANSEDNKVKLYGSPADCSDLDADDEIIEINGKDVTDCSHAEVISHIHRVGASLGGIKLHVRGVRRLFLCIKSRTIQLRVRRSESSSDVFTDHDIHAAQDAYVIATDEHARKRLDKLASLQRLHAIDMTRLSRLQHSDSREQNEIIYRDDDNRIADYPRPSGLSFVSGYEPSDLDDEVRNINMNGGTELNELNIDSRAYNERKINNIQSNTDIDIHFQKTLEKNRNSVNNSLDCLNYNETEFQGNIVYDETGPHHERAVDCPDNFVPTQKSAPRYPSNSAEQSPIKVSHTPVKKKDPPSNQVSLTKEQSERLRRHQEELRKRRDEEQRLFQEEEFLRSSLRGSKKLQALESNRNVQGFVNTAFDEIEDIAEQSVATSSSPNQSFHKDFEDQIKKNIGLEDIFKSLEHLRSQSQSAEDDEDLDYLAAMFNNEQFQNAVSLHQKVFDVLARPKSSVPECTNAAELTDDIVDALQMDEVTHSNLELIGILSNINVRSLLMSHDMLAKRHMKVASEDPDPPENNFINNYPMLHYDSDTMIKIVNIEKLPHEPLGATVRNDGDMVIIGRIVKGGAADKSGLLQEGDEILEVNGIDMRCMSIDDVSDRLAGMSGTLTFMIVPASTQPPVIQDHVMHIRAHFNYDPVDDEYIPCQELGIAFTKGDVLHVINQDDPRWWQAYREGEELDQGLAGLIPSKAFQQQRENLRLTIAADNKENDRKSRRCVCKRKGDKSKKAGLYTSNPEDIEELLTYEEVARYYPQPNRKRPIVLIGPQHIGRHELRQRLMQSNMDRFAAAVPHTSRAPVSPEIDGTDYHFVPQETFEADIQQGLFVEYGEYDKNLYGTSIAAIRKVINSGRICVLNLHAESLRILRESDLKPYVIFVCPPNLEKFRQIRTRLDGPVPSDDILKDMIDRARYMEENYGHLFDYILINTDMELAYQELLTEIDRLEVEPQWVPKQWLDMATYVHANGQYSNAAFM